MCCKARRENLISRRNEFVKVEVPYPNGLRTGSAKWDGAARVETKGWWKDNGDAVEAFISADTFWEGEVEFRVPNKRICALGIRRMVTANSGRVVGKPSTVKMLTRAARTPLEKKIHNRFPLVVINGKAYEFTEKDVVTTTVPIQKDLL